MATRYNYIQDTLGTLKDVMTTDAFVVQFSKIPAATGAGVDKITLRCNSVSIPEVGNQKVSVKLHGFSFNFRGQKGETGDITIKFTEFKDCLVGQAFREWHEYVVGTNSGNSTDYKENYSATMTVSIFDVKGVMVMQYACYNVFPTKVAGVQLDSGNSQAMTYDMTLACDYCEQLLPRVQIK